MLFKRANKPPIGKRLRNFVWPRIGVMRSLRYLGYRLVRLDASSHSIAAGVAAGVAISFTPFLGLHLIGGFTIALLTRGHLIASAIGTWIGNPWTFPLIFSLTGSIGSWYLGGDVDAAAISWSWSALWEDPLGYFAGLLPVLKPFIIGGIPCAILSWIISYSLTKRLIDGYRARKAARMAASLSEAEPSVDARETV